MEKQRHFSTKNSHLYTYKKTQSYPASLSISNTDRARTISQHQSDRKYSKLRILKQGCSSTFRADSKENLVFTEKFGFGDFADSSRRKMLFHEEKQAAD